MVGITSAGTMDKTNRLASMEMAKKGELVAAFRLPTGAFMDYAGTKLVTDIIMRKQAEPLKDSSREPWVETREKAAPSGGKIGVNQYYLDPPRMSRGRSTSATAPPRSASA